MAHLKDIDATIRFSGYEEYRGGYGVASPYVHPEYESSLDSSYRILEKVWNPQNPTVISLMIVKISETCLYEDGDKDYCWEGVAKNLADPMYCNKIIDIQTHDSCWGQFAESKYSQDNGNGVSFGISNNIVSSLSGPDMCKNVTKPFGYCQYLKVTTESNNILDCANSFDPGSDYWKLGCYKNFVIKNKNTCSQLNNSKDQQECMESLSMDGLPN